MTGLDIFTFVVMFVLLTAVAVLIKILGALPGKLAHSRAHPQADAINVCGWLGIVTLGIAWPVALVWAYTRPTAAGSASVQEAEYAQSVEAMKRSVDELSQRLTAAEQQLRDAKTQAGNDA